ncbi:MAG: hypothetical protein H9W81_13795 [Enterococcus sp.]|nr:hypothetical protein [Enterococcus sp.]
MPTTPISVPRTDFAIPETILAETELSEIQLYAVEVKTVPGLEEAVKERHEEYAVLVYYPDQEKALIYLYPEEEDVLEEIWDIEFLITETLYP